MITKRIGGLCAALGMALGLTACVDEYGYGGLSAGYGSGGYYGDSYDGYGGGGYGYSSSYGWYGDYYYPGTGIYVYDQYRRPYRWNDNQRRYWADRQRYRGRDGNGQGSWNGFDRRDGYRQGSDRRDGDRRDGDRWRGRGYDGHQWNRDRNGYEPGTPQVQGNPGTQTPLAPRQDYRGGGWRGERGYAPDRGYRGAPRRQGDGGTFTPPQPGEQRQWQGRGVERSGGGWQGRRGGGGGSAARRAADTNGQPAD